MRPDIDAGPIDRKCSESNGPCETCCDVAGCSAPARPMSDGPPATARRAARKKGKRANFMMTGSRNSDQLSARGGDKKKTGSFSRAGGVFRPTWERPPPRPPARRARGVPAGRPPQLDPDVLAAVREDAAHFPGGHARAL